MMTCRSVGSRVGGTAAGILLAALTAVPAAAQQSEPTGTRLSAVASEGAIQFGSQQAAQAAATETAVVIAEPQAPAAAPPKPNSGKIALTANLDILPNTAYVFRGITQETDAQLTLWPSVDAGFTLHSSDTGLRSASINSGLWNSLQTGSSGLDGPSEKLHYEEDYYATLTLGFAHGVALATTYTAYTSPNAGFGTTQEIAFKISPTFKYGPYVILAQELAGGADAGPNKGTYLEVGVGGPSWGLKNGKASFTIPVKFGFSLNDYYEHPVTHEDNKFGFFDIGVLVSVPLSSVSGNYGTWNLHVGADFMAFGDTTKYFNNDSSTKGVFLFGVGFTY